MNNHFFKIFLILISVLFFFLWGRFNFAQADFNPQINYQSKLTSSSSIPVADGVHCLQFLLYTTSTGGESIWSEEWTQTSTATTTISSGLFSVMLGSNSSLASVNFNQTLYLQVNYDPGCNSPATYEEEFSPRKILGAVPAAFEAKQLGGHTWTAPGAIGSATSSTGAFTTLTVSATSTFSTITIGANTLNTSEWAFLDGINQYLNTTSSPTFLGLTLTNFSGFLKATAGVIGTSTINLASDVTGTLSVGSGGTGLTTVATGSILAANQANVLTAVATTTGAKCLTNVDGTISWTTRLGTYVTSTVSTYTGNLSYGGDTGYKAGDSICNSNYSGSHMCSTAEILYTITTSFSSVPSSGNVWISNGPPGYLANANDCIGHTSSSTTDLGAWWLFSNTDGGDGWLVACSNSKQIACCK